ncbi:MAG: hypothetical protein ACK5F0_06515 [Flavobacteriales bacterium]|jgi:hypothetical protein
MKILITNQWLILSTIEFAVIVYLFVQLRKTKRINPSDLEILKARKSDINMDDVMRDMHAAPALYKALSRACHPDRFAGNPLEPVANELFQEVQQNEHNFKQLEFLKTKIQEQLHIKIKA